MNCSRCAGCMVEDYLLDLEESFEPMWLRAQRCMNCGHVAERVLQQNRMTKGVGALATRPSPVTVDGELIRLGAETIPHLAA